MSKHKLCLFGGFDLRDGLGAEITIRSKKGRCLLAYLALGQGRKVAREVLAELLWGDRGDTQARRSLSQELYRLRGLFPADMQDGFVLKAESVALSEGLFEVDVARFECSAGAADAEIAALYTGELLAGLNAGSEGFDGWLRDERARLRGLAVTIRHDILQVLMNGAAEPAIENATQLLLLESTSEDAHRALMQLFEKTGRRDLALKQYETCREILATELGIEPNATTRELHKRIAATPEALDTTPGVEMLEPDQPLPLPEKPSIAVLPFNNMSGDPEQDYFSEGIAEDIITALSSIRDLFVIARNSSFAFKGGSIDIKQVGRELGVRYVLEGGVRKAGQKVRINAQLVESESGNHLWAAKYDGDLIDIFDLQDQITESVVGVVQSSIFQAEIDRVRRKRPEIMDAYEMCMRGWFNMGVDRNGLLEARKCFQKAIEMDGWLSLAYTGLAGSHIWETTQGLSPDPKESMAAALAAAQRAVGIDEADADAHGWLCLVSLFSLPPRLDVSLAEAERAVELSPNSAMARWSRGLVYSFAERPDDGVKDLKLALRLSPRDWRRFSFLHVLALCEYTARDYSAAAETATKLVALNPEYMYGHWHLAGSLAQRGEISRAQSELREVLRLNPNFDRAFVEAWAPYRNPADLEHLFEGLTKSGWEG